MINEGIINIDTEAAKQLGFTSDRFNPASYLWRSGNTIIVSFIIAKQKGAFCRLMKAITGQGFDFEIPAPCSRMREIGEKQGWNNRRIFSEEFSDYVEILTNKKIKEGIII